MTIAFDAINIKSGGGIKHINELLKNKKKINRKIIIWGNKKVLKQLPNKKNLKKIHKPFFENYFFTIIWKTIFFRHELKKYNCKIVILLSGWGFVGKIKSISIFQNMLPFSYKELEKYNFSIFKFKMIILKKLLRYSFTKAIGIIFLSKFARDKILKKRKNVKHKVINHGIEITSFSQKKNKKNIKLVYVSNTDPYKNHIFLINGINKLSLKNKVSIYFIGEKGYCHNEVSERINTFNKTNRNIKIIFSGPKKFRFLREIYAKSDGMIFASTCENFPNIILEGMSYKLPILCPNIRPLNEIIGKNDFYYNFKNVKSLKKKNV